MKFTAIFAILAITTGLVCAGYAQNGSSSTTSRSYGDSEFQLGPGDVIQVFVFKEPDLSAEAIPVRPDGKVSLPLVGELAASGKTATQLANQIAQSLTTYLKASEAAPVKVNVIVKEVNSAQVSVLGEVRNPGQYKIKDRATLLDVIAQAGGFTEYAERDNVMVIRETGSGGQRNIKVDVEKQIKGSKNKSDLFYVMPYDKVYVQ